MKMFLSQTGGLMIEFIMMLRLIGTSFGEIDIELHCWWPLHSHFLIIQDKMIVKETHLFVNRKHDLEITTIILMSVLIAILKMICSSQLLNYIIELMIWEQTQILA